MLIKALQAHVETLKEQLAAAEARIDKQADDQVAYDAAYAAGLSAERAKVEAERAKAEQALAAAEARAEKQASDFAAREAQQAADLVTQKRPTMMLEVCDLDRPATPGFRMRRAERTPLLEWLASGFLLGLFNPNGSWHSSGLRRLTGATPLWR